MIKIEDNKLIVKCEIFKDGVFHSNYETKFDSSGKYFDGENYNFKRIHEYILSQFDFEPSTTYFSELDLTRNTLK